MSNEKVLIYEFGEFRLNLAQQTLTRNGEPLTITPRAYDLLLFLVQNRGRVLGKDELMKGVWRESFVEESNLSQNIFVLRKILGEDHNGNRFIQTIPRRGYKFVAPVRELGLRSIWVNRLGERPGPEPTKELPDLRRLPDALEEVDA